MNGSASGASGTGIHQLTAGRRWDFTSVTALAYVVGSEPDFPVAGMVAAYMSAEPQYLSSLQKSLRPAQAFLQWRSAEAGPHGKTVLVTGAARGIGEEVTRMLAGWNAHVLLACRAWLPPT